MDLKSYLKERADRINRALEGYLPDGEIIPHNLHQAMRYSVMAGGKRIRPVLMMASCEAAGSDSERVVPVACAMEMIHTYSLIHDDLPAMDDDDFRRGRPTCHKVFGEAMAILAGDALLTEAFVLLSAPATVQGLPHGAVRQIIQIMARNAGSFGMVGGQAVDIESEGKEVDIPTLEYIHTHKTGALILASVQAGALAGGADDRAFGHLTRYGEMVGLAFQIADDILDVVGDEKQLGKKVGVDEARGKATYPALFGLQEARRRAVELRDLAVAALEPFGAAAEPLRRIACYIVDRTC
ncbi:MAG: polyprenyl synthetase family protein [Deltaproteobacteria bacterium]|nr:polyprenyl synthetase family protein [Deltaproteobacteria bacterium]